MYVCHLRKEMSDKLKDIVKNNQPSDAIYLSGKADTTIQEFWWDSIGKEKGFAHQKSELYDDGFRVPADLLLAEIIPIPDIIIDVDERDLGESRIGSAARIIFFSHQYEYVAYDGTTYIIAGCSVTDYSMKCYNWHKSVPFQLIIPIILFSSKNDGVMDILGTLREFTYTIPRLGDIDAQIKLIFHQMERITMDFLSTWYGIQLALLHPVLKECFTGQEKQRKQLKFDGGSSKKGPTKYIKYCKIDDPDFINKKYEKSGYTIQRRTMIWWVIGHYREYKNGNRIFIKGYWKGPLRESGDLKEARTRQIVIEKEEE